MNLTSIAKSSIATVLVAVALALAVLVRPATAGTSAANLNIAVAVNTRCSMATGPVNFGTNYVSGQAGPQDSEGMLIVNCDAGRKVSIKLGQGLYPAAGSNVNLPKRRMYNGTGGYMGYQLYEDAARIDVWNNRPNDVRTLRVFPYVARIYGRIPGLQMVYPGAYSDTVVATVIY